MSLESLLKPAKWADEQVLRQYTKVGKRFHLDERRKKYWVAGGLNIASMCLTVSPTRILGRPALGVGIWTLTQLSDWSYNLRGIFGRVRDEPISETRVVDKETYLYKTYNSVLRLPTLAAGLGMVSKYGVDLYNHLFNGVPTDSDSYQYLNLGLGLLAASSSMYIKEMDPKLLDKAPFWKTAYNSIKEKVRSLSPEPVPQPAPANSYSLTES